MGTDQAEVLLPPEDELADRGHARLGHRAEQEHVRPPSCLGARRSEVVRAVEIDGIDVLERDEAQDLDRLRALEGNRLEIGLLDDHELALGDLPTLDELVRLDVTLVERAVALLLDRRPTLPVERPERDVRSLGGERQPDRDVDQAKADGSVPDRAHEPPPRL